MLEAAIQTKIKKELEKHGWLVVKIIQASLNGWTDLQALRNKRIVFIECKQPGKTPSDLQLYRHRQLRDQGFEVIGCATSINDIIHLCN
jgi:hypothetical protein